MMDEMENNDKKGSLLKESESLQQVYKRKVSTLIYHLLIALAVFFFVIARSITHTLWITGLITFAALLAAVGLILSGRKYINEKSKLYKSLLNFKKTKIAGVIIAGSVSLTLTACSNNDDENSNIVTTTKEITDIPAITVGIEETTPNETKIEESKVTTNIVESLEILQESSTSTTKNETSTQENSQTIYTTPVTIEVPNPVITEETKPLVTTTITEEVKTTTSTQITTTSQTTTQTTPQTTVPEIVVPELTSDNINDLEIFEYYYDLFCKETYVEDMIFANYSYNGVEYSLKGDKDAYRFFYTMINIDYLTDDTIRYALKNLDLSEQTIKRYVFTVRMFSSIDTKYYTCFDWHKYMVNETVATSAYDIHKGYIKFRDTGDETDLKNAYILSSKQGYNPISSYFLCGYEKAYYDVTKSYIIDGYINETKSKANRYAIDICNYNI